MCVRCAGRCTGQASVPKGEQAYTIYYPIVFCIELLKTAAVSTFMKGRTSYSVAKCHIDCVMTADATLMYSEGSKFSDIL